MKFIISIGLFIFLVNPLGIIPSKDHPLHYQFIPKLVHSCKFKCQSFLHACLYATECIIYLLTLYVSVILFQTQVS